MDLLPELQAEFDFESDSEFWLEHLLLELSEQISQWMAARSLGAQELARRMNRSPEYVRKILKGKPRLTLEELVKVARALDVVPRLTLEERANGTAGAKRPE